MCCGCVQEKGINKLIIQEVFRVLYSPFKAFQKLAKTPDVKGPVFILLITLLASLSAQYVNSSRTLIETEKGSQVYVPISATYIFSDQLAPALIEATFRFFLNWLIYGVAFLLVLKLFKAKEGAWHHLFIIIGYTFIVAAIFILVNVIIVSTFPTVRLEFDVWNGASEGNEEMFSQMVQKYEQAWGSLFVYKLRPYLLMVNATWTAALGAIAVHFLREVSWNKALVISAIVSVIGWFLAGPLSFYYL